jgi:crotonobetainyl-CoA:carnitine CoA-transferase CaiB-like acyl-CoA transferase
MTNRDLSADPHLAARGFFTALPHAEVGVRQHAGIPWQMSGSSVAVRHAAPRLGEHTDQVLQEILGYSPERIAALREAGVLA